MGSDPFESRRGLGLPYLPEAACVGKQELFFGPHVCGAECDGPRGCMEAKGEVGRSRRIKEAKALCMSCPERIKCLEWALETRQPFGVWGAATERDRTIIIQKRKLTGRNG